MASATARRPTEPGHEDLQSVHSLVSAAQPDDVCQVDQLIMALHSSIDVANALSGTWHVQDMKATGCSGVESCGTLFFTKADSWLRAGHSERQRMVEDQGLNHLLSRVIFRGMAEV